jgi:hypothetical protein
MGQAGQRVLAGLAGVQDAGVQEEGHAALDTVSRSRREELQAPGQLEESWVALLASLPRPSAPDLTAAASPLGRCLSREEESGVRLAALVRSGQVKVLTLMLDANPTQEGRELLLPMHVEVLHMYTYWNEYSDLTLRLICDALTANSSNGFSN